MPLVDLELTYPQGEMFKMLGQRVAFPLFVGGYGCGKSEILVANAIRDVMEFMGCKVGCYAPTHDLLGLNLIPRMEEKLDALGIAHHLNKSKHILNIEGSRQVIFRSMDNPARIVAYEVYRSHVDEADLMHTAKKGEEAWNRIIARNRQLRVKKNKPVKKNGDPNLHKQHFNMVSGYTTPEGYKFTYKRWKKEPGEGYRYVTAPTSTNWNLPASFIKNLESTYTPAQCKAYLEGIWTNIFTGSVYSYYDRDEHSTERCIGKGDILHIGQDFNYGGSCGAVYVPFTALDQLKSNNLKKYKEAMQVKKTFNQLNNRMLGLQMVDEYAAQDTEQIIVIAKERYCRNRVIFYPDASAKSNATNASASDLAMIRSAGFEIRAKSANPRIVDRINSLQRLLYNKRFFINVNNCPRSAEAIEEHAFSEITGLPEKFAGPATIDDRNDGAGYCPAFLHPIKKVITTTTELPL